MPEPDLNVFDELLPRSTLLSVYRRTRMFRIRRPIGTWLVVVGVPALLVALLEGFVPSPISWLVLLSPSVLFVGIMFSIAQAAVLCLSIPVFFLLLKVRHDPSGTAMAWQVAIWSLLHFGTCTALLAGWKSTIRRAAEIAERDTLTGAGNSTSFYRAARQAIASCLSERTSLTVAVADCDSFKPFNDTRGHLAGDEFLKQVAQTIQNRLRPGDRLIRWGGDEFVILFPDCSHECGKRSIDDLRQALAAALAPSAGSVTFSWGLVTYDLPPADAESLLRDADALMYEAKNAGGDRVCSRHIASDSSRVET